MVIFDNPATVPAPFGQYSHVARVELGDRTLLQLSGQVAIDADGKVVGNDMASQAEYIMDRITAILAAHPRSFDALHLLAILRCRQGTVKSRTSRALDQLAASRQLASLDEDHQSFGGHHVVSEA